MEKFDLDDHFEVIYPGDDLLADELERQDSGIAGSPASTPEPILEQQQCPPANDQTKLQLNSSQQSQQQLETASHLQQQRDTARQNQRHLDHRNQQQIDTVQQSQQQQGTANHLLEQFDIFQQNQQHVITVHQNQQQPAVLEPEPQLETVIQQLDAGFQKRQQLVTVQEPQQLLGTVPNLETTRLVQPQLDKAENCCSVKGADCDIVTR